MFYYISIEPQFKGLLYFNNKFSKELAPGVYRVLKPFTKVNVHYVPQIPLTGYISQQEVLTKDNIALRCSVYYTYLIEDGRQYVETAHNHSLTSGRLEYAQDDRLVRMLQERLRLGMSEISSIDLNNQRLDLMSMIVSQDVIDECTKLGIQLKSVALVDVNFPKHIQEVFASELASKIRSRVDLENARTAVATARTLKNAAEMIHGDEGMKYLQLLETLQKIAQKGNHTFVLGEQLLKSK